VRDAEAAAAFYTATLGIGPFDFQEAVLDGDYQYKGKPDFCRLRIATCQSGEVQIELIEVLEGRHPSGSYLERYGEGINHLAFEVDDLEGLLTRLLARDVEVLIRGSVTLESEQSLLYTYVAAGAPGLPMFEFVQYR
jgi:catechol 2,3-dioxygenase-like lactoylglutathione lyase family enzyme